MKKAKMILNKVLYPSKWILISVPPIVFAALIFIFAANKTESAAAYPIYGLSAYSLIIWLVSAPKLLRSVKTGIMNNRAVKKIAGTKIGGRYLSDMAFRGSIGIYQGMAVNFLYLLFRVIAGIRYASVWFISIAVYYLVLGTLRAYLIFSYRRRKKYGLSYEYRCYRRTAWLLFLLNIPMGGMIVLMIRANAGYTYPGYVIYLSALYTFYTMILSVVNLVRFRKIGSPILSAAKVLNFVASMMSILGLQTAMIAQFSEGDTNFRRLMNTVTGSGVYGTVIIIAVYMLIHSAQRRREEVRCEQI